MMKFGVNDLFRGRIRKNGTCDKCGKSDCEVIFEFSNIDPYIRARMPFLLEIIFEIKYGEWLCRDCYYGRGLNIFRNIEVI